MQNKCHGMACSFCLNWTYYHDNLSWYWVNSSKQILRHLLASPKFTLSSMTSLNERQDLKTVFRINTCVMGHLFLCSSIHFLSNHRRWKLWSSGREHGFRSEGRRFDPCPMLDGSGKWCQTHASGAWSSSLMLQIIEN